MPPVGDGYSADFAPLAGPRGLRTDEAESDGPFALAPDQVPQEAALEPVLVANGNVTRADACLPECTARRYGGDGEDGFRDAAGGR